MKSMTGFGRGTAQGDGFSAAVDLKTVNNRFLDIHLRTSTDLTAVEAAVRKRIGERLSRGRVDVNISVERTSEVTYELNRPLIAGFITAIREMQKEFGLSGEPVENYRARVYKRISELLARDGLEIVELDQGRLAQEVAYLADRSDITEEVARLRSHVAQFRAALSEEGDTGKRLDFLLQEFNREANTVLSKSTDLAIKDAALGIKAAVEKLREQVQNVE